MAALKKIVRKMLIGTGVLLLICVMAIVLFINFYPSFGGDLSKELAGVYTKSPNFKEGKFINTKEHIPEKMGFGKMLSVSRKFFFSKVPNGMPKSDISVKKVIPETVTNYQGEARLLWFGHSAFLLQTGSKNILIDPMLGKVAAPHEWLGSKRFNSHIPLSIEAMPTIDAVLISHDHYDHLDYPSIKSLASKVKIFYVPLGVGIHLKTWGIEANRIVELDWWEEARLDGITFACTPAQHFSGRKFSNGQSTLWGSWVVHSKGFRLFFSGDSGYGPHFTKIGETYGPFDLALMECGQYNEMWPDIHMFPEETVQAGLDVRAAKIIPIHWGGFKLALHSWIDPIERVLDKGKELGLPIVTPQIGEFVSLKGPKETSQWWKKY